MRGGLFVSVAVGVLALGLAGIALADHGLATDPAGDVKHNPPGKDARYDIVKETYGHNKYGKLVQTVRVKGNTFAPTGPGAPLLWIDVPGKVAHRLGCQYSDYFVNFGGVFECGDGPKTGAARVSKVDAHTLRFVFRKGAIGKPSRYGITFVTEGSNAQGNQLLFFDRAPDTGFFEHVLG